MSQERILNALKSLGLSQIEADVYLFLANNGPQKTTKIMADLKLQEQQISDSLERLTNRGVINLTQEHSALFYALPFEKALEILVKERLKRAQTIEEKKSRILSEWKDMIADSTN